MAEIHISAFKVPAGPPEANALNKLSGTDLLVAGVLAVVLVGKNVPVGAVVKANHVGAWIGAANAGPLTAEWDAGTQTVTVTSANVLDVNRVQWELWW